MKKILIFLAIFSTLTHSSYVSIGSVDWTNQDLKDALKEFTEVYKRRPIKDNYGGMLSPQMFFTWFVVKRLQPKFIIESGVYKGQSTWLFEQAAPNAKIISIDPNLHFRKYISPRVRYETTDFSRIDWSFLEPANTVCFFDDHYGLDRIKQCYERGFKHILYEDNYPIPGGNQYNPAGNAYAPKAAFKAQNKDAKFLYDILEIYYEFPPIIPNFSTIKNHAFYEMNSKTLTHKCFSWDIYKDVTPQPLYNAANEDYLKVYENDAHNYNWYAYMKLQ